MSTFEQYENLPGVKVSYEDGNLFSGTQSTTATTQSILIIGTAIDGPVGEPVSVNSIGGPKAAEKLFGGMLERKTIYDDGIEKTVKVPHQGTLIRAMWEAIRSGNEDIRLLRVSGRAAKTELPVKDPNSEVLQPLADSLGNQLITGNIAFSKALNMASDLRLVKIEKIEEFEGTDTTATPYKTFNDATGYQNVDSTPGSETVYFPKDKFRPKNTIKITYKAKKRNYTEVTRNMDGQSDESTLGLLTQDPTMTNYFGAEVGNWSDDAKHQVNVYIKDSTGSVNTIPSLNSKGERLYRIGKEDNTVTDELNQVITDQEFKQGGIRFTSAYEEEVEKGTYPALNSSVTVTADYFYYNDLEIQESVTQIVPGKEKETFLNHTPESGSLEVYFESSGIKNILKENVDYTIVYPTEPNKKVSIMIKAGIGPVGAKLYAYYKTGENSTQGGRLIVQAKYPGTAYGGIEDIKDYASVYGVKTTVEYEVNANGTLDIENRVIRFIKPSDKKTTSTDNDLVFRTKDLKGVTTLREFANYVNSLSNNNIVYLDVPLDYGGIAVTGLLVTDYEVNSVTGKYEYRPINLGEIYDESIPGFRLNIDDSKSQNDPNRFPWLGTNGFFNTANLADTKAYYETLGGTYGLVEGTIDEYEPLDQGIYSKLENYAVDIISLADVNANTAIGKYDDEGALVVDTERNFATQLAQHCALVTAKTWETIGVIGVAASPLSGLRDVQQYIDLLIFKCSCIISALASILFSPENPDVPTSVISPFITVRPFPAPSILKKRSYLRLARSVSNLASDAIGGGISDLGSKTNDLLESFKNMKGKNKLLLGGALAVAGIAGYNILNTENPVMHYNQENQEMKSKKDPAVAIQMPEEDYSTQNASISIKASGKNFDKDQVSQAVSQSMQETRMNAGPTRITINHQDNTQQLNRIWYRDKVRENV
ncbi:hypothetical protein [Bacillus subtilis]|uniref:hypothetical protein n=1 Tax=Bacillus subtilis TaxID=1423 RepID=UPI0013BB0239|nr:hypothetical protein [Bacillus subtilis]KAF2421693.1 hypothetical protein B6K89_21105 [Bacillus subtilis]